MRYQLLLLGALLPLGLSAQSSQAMSLQEAEHLFLEHNSEIQTTKAEVSVAKSEIRQAKLFNNPELSFEQINFWSDATRRAGEKKSFAVTLAQEIRLGGKRKKEIELARLNHQLASLKQVQTKEEGLLQFRSTVIELDYLNRYHNLLQEELRLLQQITKTYRKQKELGFVSASHLMRVQTAAYELEQEIVEVRQQSYEVDQLLHTWMGIPIQEDIQINWDPKEHTIPDAIAARLTSLSDTHPLVLLQQGQIQRQQKNLALEQVNRIPEVGLSGTYDRRGGVWPNYFGVGISFKLPLFNRNQGQIQAVQTLLALEQTQLKTQKTALANQIQSTFKQYQELAQFEHRLSSELSYGELAEIQASYTRNLLQKNISLIEFLDFISAHREALQIQLETTKNRQIQYFRLRYLVGHQTTRYEN